ncbi:MAG: aminotransferase class III-fold pyridoxal phosphate-dependent enzyme [Polyangiales bacterium]
MEPTDRYARSQALYRRAQRLIPGAVHLSGRCLIDPARSPLYFERGHGSRVWDVDGHEYIDLFMAFGPYLLGYARPEVDEAARAQLARGHLLSMNHPLHLDFVEAVVARFPGAEMGAFFRTGSEAATAALRIARRATGRRVVARCGYHGWHDWCLPLEPWVPAGLDRQVLEFRASEPATLRRLFEENPGAVAAVILAPEMILPYDEAALRELATITRAAGAVFILDEVKTAFRTPPGSLQRRAGVVPDLTAVSKALGNGWPVAAVVGSRAVMEHGAGLHVSATYHGDTAAMAAALATLEIIERERAAEHAWRQGERLIRGLDAIARAHGVPAEAYGEPLPPMPFLRFTHPEPATRDLQRDALYAGAYARGVLLHPRHLWFTSLAHTDADIERVLSVCDDAMREARQVPAA